MKKYEFLDHKADLRVRAYGKNFEEATINSAYAIKEIILEKKLVKSLKEKKTLKIKGKSKEEILHKFIEEIIFIFDSENLLFVNVEEKTFVKNDLCVVAKFQKIDGEKINNPIKAIVYNDILIKETKEKTIIEFTLDI